MRGLVSVLRESPSLGDWSTDCPVCPPSHTRVLHPSHQCPCLSSALGLPTGPRSWSLSQGIGSPRGTTSPSEMEMTTGPGFSCPILHGKFPLFPRTP